ncbi:unnamed protein product [Rotaria magnacalcarata]
MGSMEQIKQSFDSILSKFDENNNLSSDITSIKEIFQSILYSNEKYFAEPDFIHHCVFIFLRDWYLNLLEQWRHSVQLDNASCYAFETIPNLFIKMSNHISDKNVSILKQLIFHKSLLNELNMFFEEIASNGKYLQDPQIKSLDNIFRAIHRLEKRRRSEKNTIIFFIFFYPNNKLIMYGHFSHYRGHRGESGDLRGSRGHGGIGGSGGFCGVDENFAGPPYYGVPPRHGIPSSFGGRGGPESYGGFGSGFGPTYGYTRN